MKQTYKSRNPAPIVEPAPIDEGAQHLRFVQIPFDFEFLVQEGDEPCEQS
jgi:hypothetical protein